MVRVSRTFRRAVSKYRKYKENLKYKKQKFKQALANNAINEFRMKGTISTATAVKLNLFLTLEERKELFNENKGLGKIYSWRIAELGPF